MRSLLMALGVLALSAGGAVAQHQRQPPTPPKPAAAAPAAKAQAKYTLETPIHVLMEDPVTLAWLDKHFPGLSERMRDPEVGTIFAGASIDDMSKDADHGRALTPEVMAKLKVSLEAAQAGAAPAS